MRFALPCLVLLVALFGYWGLAVLATFTWPVFAAILVVGTLLSSAVLVWGLGEEAQSLHYVATSQRALVMKSRAGKIAAWDGYELAQAHKMRVVAQGNGVGTLIFVKRQRFVWDGQSGGVATYEISFKSIGDAEKVFTLVKSALPSAHFPPSS